MLHGTGSLNLFHFQCLFFLPPPVLPALPCSFSDLSRARRVSSSPLVVNIFLPVFSGPATNKVPYPPPSPFFPVKPSPPHMAVTSHAIHSAGAGLPVQMLVQIGILKGFVYSSSCFSWFLEVGNPHNSYLNLHRSHIVLLD